MKLKKWIMAILLLILIAPSHLIANDQTITIDEPWWLISGSNYYYALTHEDFANTRYDYHPAVTTTWIVTAGMLFYFPEYRAFGQDGYFDVRKPNYEEFLREQGKQVLGVLQASRVMQTIVILLFALLAFYFLHLILNEWLALLSVALAMLSPFFLGHARLLNHEGILAIFVLVSFLAFQVYLNKERNLIYLLLSGASFGLAQLTKSSSIVLVGLVGLMLLMTLFRKDEKTFSNKFLNITKTFAIWLTSAVVIYFILWPGMWVRPFQMLGEVYGNAFSYAFQGARLDVTEELKPAEFNFKNLFSGIRLYLQYWLSGTTFITWLGLIFAVFRLFKRESTSTFLKSTIVYLFILASLFVLIFSIAGGRNYAHYIMSTFVALDVVAGIGWGSVWLVVQKQFKRLNEAYVSLIFIVILVLTQIGFGLPYAPYYFTYKNPLAKQPATFGYGEGYNVVADYLNSKPNSQEIKAYVYNGMGTFSYLFAGETLVFKRVYVVDDSYEQIVEEIQLCDYLVLYPVIREKQPETEKLFTAFENVLPEKTIVINGMDYVYIYNVSEIPEHVYEALINQ